MSLIEGISELFTKFWNFLQDCLDAISTAIFALYEFYDLLKNFDNRIISMTDSCGATEFDGVPVVKAIATYHYVVGDIVFYLMYLIILFGCLLTIWKIIILLYKAIGNAINFTKDCFSGTSIGNIFSKFFSGGGGV